MYIPYLIRRHILTLIPCKERSRRNYGELYRENPFALDWSEKMTPLIHRSRQGNCPGNEFWMTRELARLPLTVLKVHGYGFAAASQPSFVSSSTTYSAHPVPTPHDQE